MKVLLVGTISLPVVVGSYLRQITKEVNFLVMDCSSSYNVIIRWPTLNDWKVATSTYHLFVKFLTKYGTGEVQGDQLAARECYLAMLAMDEQMQTMNIKEKRTMAESIEVLEDVQLDESNSNKFTRIGTSIEEKTKQELVQFLKKSTGVFTLSHEDMLGIDPNVITHGLNVSPFYKPICQKRRVFAPERVSWTHSQGTTKLR